jgi:hypothetical protein
MKKAAILSDDKMYRYQLSRIWDESKPHILFIMLNPSIADAATDDPTIRRVIRFAASWGYGGIYVANLYAFRSTDPKALKHADDPVGKENVSYITHLIGMADKVVYAWGNNQKEPTWLSELVQTPYCIDLSKNGIPKHPLYLKSELIPKVYVR